MLPKSYLDIKNGIKTFCHKNRSSLTMEDYLKKLKEYKNQQGFSLLELVVAVGVILVLTVGGLLAYNGITDNARQSSVQRAADEVYGNAMARYTGAVEGNPSEADVDWKASASKDNQINVETKDLGNGKYQVTASYGEDEEYKTVRTTPETGNAPIPGDENTPPENGNDFDFLDNPSKLPDGIDEAPDFESRLRLYAEEVSRRNVLFVDFQVERGELIQDELLDKWNTATYGSFSGVCFEDPDFGTMCVLPVRTQINGNITIHYAVIAYGVEDGQMYYLVNEANRDQIDNNDREMFEELGARPFTGTNPA